MEILKVKTKRRKIGDVGEEAAQKHLRRQGYRILERGYVACGYEIDLIAQTRDTLVFVEVKTRSSEGSPREPRPSSSVTPEKQRKILRAASYYKLHSQSKKKMRFDIVEVLLDGECEKLTVKEVRHLIGAFDGDTAYPPRFPRP